MNTKLAGVWFKATFMLLLALALLATLRPGLAQYSEGASGYDPDDGSWVEHFPCPQFASFYATRQPTHYEFKDSRYYFPANPFELHTYLGGVNYWAEMHPTGGTIEMTNTKVWKQASITVECFLRRRWTIGGIENRPITVIRHENGYLANVSGASLGDDQANEDVYEMWLDGVRFICYNANGDDGTRTTHCDAAQ